MKAMKTTSFKLFQPATLAALAVITLWGVSIRHAEAGYTVTLQQVGPSVVATGSGAIDLTGLSLDFHHILTETDMEPANGGIFTGTTAFADIYRGNVSGPSSFGFEIEDAIYTHNASGDMVGIYSVLGNIVVVPQGYISGTPLSNTATWTGWSYAVLGVAPGTYVWTWGPGANQKFTLKILPSNGYPILTTNRAAFITSFSATLKGSLSGDGLNTTFHFEYGTTASYGLTTAPQTQTGGTSGLVSANINGLTAHTTYHFRIVASNATGTNFGRDRTFTTLTLTGPPVVTTNPATNVTAESATLNGTLDPHGLRTTVYFQYGTTTSYGSRTPNQIKAGNNYQNVLATLSGLAGSTRYHFRIVASNAAGTRYGSDRILRTHLAP